MKLLQINVTSNWGSTGKIAEQIGQCAMRHGWESYVAYGRMHNPSQNKLIRIGTMADAITASNTAHCRLPRPRRAVQNLLQLIDDLQNGRDTSIKEGPCSKA